MHDEIFNVRRLKSFLRLQICDIRPFLRGTFGYETDVSAMETMFVDQSRIIMNIYEQSLYISIVNWTEVMQSFISVDKTSKEQFRKWVVASGSTPKVRNLIPHRELCFLVRSDAWFSQPETFSFSGHQPIYWLILFRSQHFLQLTYFNTWSSYSNRCLSLTATLPNWNLPRLLAWSKDFCLRLCILKLSLSKCHHHYCRLDETFALD